MAAIRADFASVRTDLATMRTDLATVQSDRALLVTVAASAETSDARLRGLPPILADLDQRLRRIEQHPPVAAAATENVLPTSEPQITKAGWRRIQVGLSQSGFDPGPINGWPGKRTRAAIVAYQAASGAAPTGPLTEGQSGRSGAPGRGRTRPRSSSEPMPSWMTLLPCPSCMTENCACV